MREEGSPPPIEPWRRVRIGLALLAVVLVFGSLGYMVLGLGPLDAVYQTVTTVFTVGFREVGEPDRAWKLYTVVLIVLGVGTSLYTLGLLLESLVEGRLSDQLGRRRMERRIANLRGHVIVCGWGRVGHTLASHLTTGGTEVVVVERDPGRAATVPHLHVVGDATADDTLRRAGIEHARALVTALTTDADNLYVTLTARSARPDLFVVARARDERADAKLVQAGANRVVNPQHLGGARIAALVLQPNVTDFLDVVMHDGNVEFRLAEVLIGAGSPIVGQSLRESHIRDSTGALVLAMRDGDGAFLTNPPPDTGLGVGQVLIAIGTGAQLEALEQLAAGGRAHR